MRFHMDKLYFSQAMALAKGNETRAAKLLNLKPHTFRYQYKKNVEAQETAAEKTDLPQKGEPDLD